MYIYTVLLMCILMCVDLWCMVLVPKLLGKMQLISLFCHIVSSVNILLNYRMVLVLAYSEM